MSRSNKKGGGGGFIGIVVFLGIIVGLLFAVFSFVPGTSDGAWPLGIDKQEVRAYRSLFDLSSDSAKVDMRVTTLNLRAFGQDSSRMLSATHPASRWMYAILDTDDGTDTVRVRRLRSTAGSYVMRLSKYSELRMDLQTVLIPADITSMRAKYAEVMAQELGLVAPEISFVRLSINGEDQGLFLREAKITQQLLEKKKLGDATYFEHGFSAYDPRHGSPDMGDSASKPIIREKIRLLNELVEQGNFEQVHLHLDVRSALALLLMMWSENRLDPLLQEGAFAYNNTTGRIKPLYRSLRESDRPERPHDLAINFLSPLLQDQAMYKEFESMRAKFSGESWRLKERFSAMDEVWLPLVASSDAAFRVEQVQAIANGQKEELLSRLGTGDVRRMFTKPTLVQAGSATWEHAHDSLITYTPSNDPSAELESLAKRYGAIIVGDTLLFPRGKFVIEQDLYIPPGKSLQFRSGARIFLGPDVNILCYGPLNIRGSLLRPVFVRAVDPARPWGTIAVCGNGNMRCEFQGSYISDGREAIVNGLKHTGMVSIHNSDARFIECTISDSHGEDLVNVKNGDVLMRDCIFKDAHADIVDLDNVSGTVDRCVFKSKVEDHNGDCLDVSGTRVLIHQNQFLGSPDKGVSVGEASEVLLSANRFDQNHTAIAVKDLSVAYVVDNIFINNQLAFDVFRKKPIFGGGRLVLYTNEFFENKEDRRVDALSTVVQKAELDAALKERFGLDESMTDRRRRRR